MGVLEMVQAQYPSLVFLLGDPELGPLLAQAVDPFTGFDPNTFQAKLQETNWFRSRTREARENEIRLATDPATHWAELGEYADSVDEQFKALAGRGLDANERLWFAAIGTNQGIPADSATMRNWLRGLVNPAAVMQGVGTAGAAKNEIENLVRGQWFAPLDLGWLAQAGISVATQGGETLESINARLASQAYNWYPHLRKQITEGQTMADIFQPYRALISEELELGGAENVSMNSTEWSQLAQWRDPETGEMRLPTMSEVQVLARNRPQWWQTANGRKTDAGSTAAILRMFGQRA